MQKYTQFFIPPNIYARKMKIDHLLGAEPNDDLTLRCLKIKKL